ncbi:RHS repeat-associated core domain-containing protein [Stenotrophomonas rhizophila]|uniref:RHS repeat-associated core domain-containing protein n=1 Tax=Stenotrophomonas rhizophila TaxID=216778 RepID=UPI001E575912|nr:RHS repeat-associated core domain-containing protein [Stenotrophomonas rhizophila]
MPFPDAESAAREGLARRCEADQNVKCKLLKVVERLDHHPQLGVSRILTADIEFNYSFDPIDEPPRVGLDWYIGMRQAWQCSPGYVVIASGIDIANNSYPPDGISDSYFYCMPSNSVPVDTDLGEPLIGSGAMDAVCTRPVDSGYVGNPIHAGTFNKFAQVVDIDAPSALRWVRYYNSGSFRRGTDWGVAPILARIGSRWRHGYDLQVIQTEYWSSDANAYRSAIKLVRADGGIRIFHEVDGRYIAQNADETVLSKLADGGWIHVDVDEKLEHYSPDGRLLMIEDRNGNATRLAYSTPDTAAEVAAGHSGLLIGVSDQQGRALSIAYDASGRVARVTGAAGTVVSYGYDEIDGVGLEADLVAVSQADGTTLTYRYNEPDFTSGKAMPHALTGIIDEQGARYATYRYAFAGQALGSEHAGGADAVHLEMDYSGTTVFNALEGQQEYRFSPVRGYTRLIEVQRSSTTGSPSAARYLEYDKHGTISQRTGFGDSITRYQYEHTDNNSGRPLETSRTEAAGTAAERTITTDWHPSLRLPTRIHWLPTADTGGRQLEREYDGAGNMVLQRWIDDAAPAATRITQYTYDDTGRPLSVDGPRTDVADRTQFRYYPQDAAGCADSALACDHRKGDLWQMENALGQVTEILAYDGAGRALRVSDPNGVLTEYAYHARGGLSRITVRGATAATDRNTLISYWPTGQVQRVTESDGGSVTYLYDAAQRLTDVADSAGNSLHYTLDNAGNRIKQDIVDSDGVLRHTLSRVHNNLSQLIALKDADENASTYTYDANGNPASVTDALQRKSTLQHDPLDRQLRGVEDASGVAASIEARYTATDQVAQVTDPKGLSTTYTYNGFGDLIGQVSPDSGETTYGIDAAGNRNTRTDARGVTATYHYDALNRLTGIAYPDPNLDVGYSYDHAPVVCAADEQFSKGRLSKVLHAGGSTEYCHDRFGQLTRKLQTVNGVTTTLRYSYTAAGRLAGMTYPDGSVVDYARNNVGQISAIGLTRPGHARQVVLSQVSHAPFGPATGWTYGNGRQLQRLLDLNYRPLAVRDPAAGGLWLSYGYDPVGAITDLKDGDGSTPLVKYGYDTLGRLTHAKDGATGTAIETYAYDATGNRTALTTAAGTASYTYPADSHRLTAVDAQARSHDAAGNTTGIGDREFSYNDANRMDAVKQGGAVMESYGYNHKGERVLRAPASADAQVTVYDEAGRWVGNYGPNGQQQQAIWLDNHPVALINTPSAGVPEVAYIQPDHLGTPRVVIDPARDVAIWAWSSKSEVFGNQVPNEDPDRDGVDYELALRFPGQQATDASGMFYNYQREYEALTGRYSQSDPIGLEGGISTYAYAAGRPTVFVDPLGLEGVGYWNNGEMSSITGYVAASSCESEAAADLLVDLVPITAMASFALDVAGVDFNFYEPPYVQFGEYGVKTPFAAAGHAADAVASRAEAKAVRQLQRATEAGIHYSVANGRRNRAAASMSKAGIIRGGAKFLGPLGAFVNYRENFNKCQCQAK